MAHSIALRTLRSLAPVMMGILVYAICGVGVVVRADSNVSEAQAAALQSVERVAYGNDWATGIERRIKKGAHVFLILRTPEDSCTTIETTIPNIRFFTFYPTTLEAPSSENSRAGIFHDALFPRNSDTCSLSRYVFVEWQPEAAGSQTVNIGSTIITINVQFEGVFKVPDRPMMIAAANYYLIQGHCDQYCKMEADLGQKYSSLLFNHHIQPIQTWVHVPPIVDGVLDLDHNKAVGHSFRQTVLKYQRHGRVEFPKAPSEPAKATAYLKALEATVQRENWVDKAWIYAVDEPVHKADGTPTNELIQELQRYRQHAPSVKIMVTTNYSDQLVDLVDIFAPVYNNLVSPKPPTLDDYAEIELWSYVSCMGSCGPNRRCQLNPEKKPGLDTGLPDFLIDRPADRLFAFFRKLEEINADGGLYYESTEGYPLVRKGVNLLEDPWNFGGNGDGLLIYPGRKGKFGLDEHIPLPSIRLKLIRHAIENEW